jgi:hypothetical protein
MRISEPARPRPLRESARLGFDHGWLRLNPTFLNLRCPGLLVDRLWIGNLNGLGFEPLGERDPRRPFPTVRLTAYLWDSGIQLRAAHNQRRHLAACTTLSDRHEPQWWTAALHLRRVLLLIGDTHRVELSWAALFDCTVGITRVDRIQNPNVPLDHQRRAPEDVVHRRPQKVPH